MAAVVLNDFSTTLAAPLAIDGTTVTVTTGAPAAAVGQELRIRVGREIVRVTVDTATSWTVIERAAEDAARFPAQAHDAGTRVLAPLTAAGLAEFVAENATPFDEAGFLAAPHTWDDTQTFAGGTLVVGANLTLHDHTATQHVHAAGALALEADGLASVYGAGGVVLDGSTGQVTARGTVSVRPAGGMIGEDELLLTHDLTRGVLQSLSGGLAVRNAADDADVLTVSDSGRVTATEYHITTAANVVYGHLPASLSGTGHVLCGRSLTVTGTDDTVNVGINNTVRDRVSAAIGRGCVTGTGSGGGQDFAMGLDCTAENGPAVAVGAGAHADGFRSLAVGFETAVAHRGIGFGEYAGTDANGDVVFGVAGAAPFLKTKSNSSTTNGRSVAGIRTGWVDQTDATRTGYAELGAYSTTTFQVGVRVEADAAGVRVSTPAQFKAEKGFHAGPLVTEADAATVTFDLTQQTRQVVTLGGNRTIDWTGDSDGLAFTLGLVQGGAGSHTVTWAKAVKWVGGTPPTLSTAAGATDWVSIFRVGAEYHGTYSLGHI